MVGNMVHFYSPDYQISPVLSLGLKTKAAAEGEGDNQGRSTFYGTVQSPCISLNLYTRCDASL